MGVGKEALVVMDLYEGHCTLPRYYAYVPCALAVLAARVGLTKSYTSFILERIACSQIGNTFILLVSSACAVRTRKQFRTRRRAWTSRSSVGDILLLLYWSLAKRED